MKNKFTVLQVTPALHVGGIERGAVEMANYINEQGCTSIIASNGGQMESDLNDSVMHIQLPLHKRNPWSLYKCAKEISEIIHEHGVDVVHSRSRIPSWAARLACNWTKTPMVATYHGTHKNQNAIKKWYNSGAARADRVIAISQFIKSYVMDNFGTKEEIIDIAPRGVDPEIFAPQHYTSEELEKLKEKHDIPSNTPILNLTGRITRWKGHTEWVNLLAGVKDLEWTAIIVGSGGKKQAYENELKDLIKSHGLEGRFLFLGGQKNPAAFYLMSDLAFSMATQPEAFGRVSIEAQAMGTAIFATGHGRISRNRY